MEKAERPLFQEDLDAALERRLVAQHLQEIEGNPLAPDEIAMFEMFERERWTPEQCRAFIDAKARAYSKVEAAE